MDCLEKNLIELHTDLISYGIYLTQSVEKAENLVQETFLKVLENRETYQENNNLKSYCFIILKHSFINEYRKKQKFLLKYQHRLPENNEDKGGNIYSTIQLEDVLFFLKKLKPIHKKVFLLHISGFKYKEIAEKHNLPIGTIKSIVHHVRKKIKKYHGKN